MNKKRTSRSWNKSTHRFWQEDLGWFLVLALLGAVASHLNIQIPYTGAFIEGRWLFGYMGFVLLQRWWVALLLACVLSVTLIYQFSVATIFIGNMLYAFPIFLVIRFVHPRLLARLRNIAAYGAAWFLLILLCYQAFTTPAVWGILAFLQNEPVIAGIIQGWREQPYLFESLLVGLISALGLMVVRVHRDLRASQRELATTLYSIGDAVIATDTTGCVQRMNVLAETLTGWTEAEALEQPLENVFRIVNEQTRRPVSHPVERVLTEGIVVGLSNHTLLIARDGAEYPIADSGAPIRDGYDGITGVVLVFRDQTEERAFQKKLKQQNTQLQAALSEKETLLRELYHRTKNNMQVIASILTLQAAQVDDPQIKKFVQDTENKIYAMALVHEKLYQSKDLSRIDMNSYLTELAELIVENYTVVIGNQIKINYNIQDVSMLIDTAIPSGLIVNELLTNALKYAFPDGYEGEIELSLQQLPDDKIEIRVSDNGVGVNKNFDFFGQRTLGIQTVISLVTHQLQGSVEFKSDKGVTCIIRFRDDLYRSRV